MKASNYALNAVKRIKGGVAILELTEFNDLVTKLQKLEDIEYAAIRLLQELTQIAHSSNEYELDDAIQALKKEVEANVSVPF